MRLTHLVALSISLGAILPAQTSWARTADLPVYVTGHAQAFDEERGRTVLFGGCADPVSSSNCLPRNWTFVHDGNSWTQVFPANQPSARFDAEMVYDRVRSRIVLFGGFDSGAGTPSDETWAWDGTDWTQLTPTQSPSARSNHAMAYDSFNDLIVLYGGGSGAAQSETWTFDGNNWQLASPVQSPPPALFHQMAFDESRRRTVMVSPQAPRGTVYEFDGSNWTTIQAPSGPNTSGGGGMAYDATRGLCVLVAASVAWEWNGSTWTLRFPPIPQTVGDGEVDYDRDRRSLIHSGGFACDISECPLSRMTWEYRVDNPAIAAPFGEGCNSITGPLTLQVTWPDLPWIGGTFRMRLSPIVNALTPVAGLLGTSRTQLGAAPLPIQLTALGRPDCILSTSSDLSVPILPTPGFSIWSIPIPQDNSLVGLTFYLQGVTVEPGSLIATSNAIQATVGAP